MQIDIQQDIASIPRAGVCELTILMPCLNEAETLATCINKAMGFLKRSGINGEVLIADNGSTDGSQDIAESLGARVLPVETKGYGSALQEGIRAARGRYVIMGDSDDSYDFSRLDAYITQLRAGYQFVMGNRFKGGISPGAMPPLHRYFGNPVLTAIGRLFFGSDCRDFQCGLRGFDRATMLTIDFQCLGMEFASEMVVKATIHGLRITEVPTTLSPDGRSRPPHMRSWRDGWRNLRFLLLFSPKWLFLYPGATLFLVGLVMMIWLLPAPRQIGGVTLDIHTLFYASLAVVVGFHSMLFWMFAKIFGMRAGLVPADPRFIEMTQVITLEIGLIIGIALILLGLGLGIYAISSWGSVSFGALLAEQEMRVVIPSGTAILLGFHIVFGAFFVSLLGIGRK